jgi:UDP-2,3-diacylglucosamine pyrophosphatase LpxH
MTDMTREKAIQKLRADRDAGNDNAKMFYKLMETAHPNIVDYMEKKAADLLIGMSRMGAHLAEDLKDPEKRKEVLAAYERAAAETESDVEEALQKATESKEQD